MLRPPVTTAARVAALAMCTTFGAAAQAQAAAVVPDPSGYVLQITDGVRLSADGPLPDQIGSGSYAPDDATGFANLHQPFPTVYRGSAVVAASRPIDNGFVALDDLRAGDQIALQDGLVSGDPEVARYTYTRALGLDGPICAGQTSYAGSRTPGSNVVAATSVTWVPDPNYPGDATEFPMFTGVPGGEPGWLPTQTGIDTVTPVGNDRITYSTARPLVAGMRVTMLESFYAAADLRVSVQETQVVQACATPMPVTTPTPVPSPTPVATPTPSPSSPDPSPTPVPGAVPLRDATAPTLTAAVPTSRDLAKLGRSGVVKSGIPVVFTTDEAGTLAATIGVVDGAKQSPVKAFHLAVAAGANPLLLRWSKSAQKILAAAGRGAKLEIAISETDAAGNASAARLITRRLPG